MAQIAGVFLSLSAYTLQAFGNLLMKKGIRWQNLRTQKDKTYYRSLALWIAGFFIAGAYIVPNIFALRYIPPYIVSAMTGWGVLVVVGGSFLLLGERIRRETYLFGFLIVAGIFFLNYFKRQQPAEVFRLEAYWCLMPAAGVSLLTGILSPRGSKGRIIGFAVTSGISAGFMLVSIDILEMIYGFDLKAVGRSPMLTLVLMWAALNFVFLQLSYRHGRMILIGPLYFSSNIIFTTVASALVFKEVIGIVQLAAIGVIIGSVSRILSHQ
jgi:drug/metabolite transporter (DMT)-like permease